MEKSSGLRASAVSAPLAMAPPVAILMLTSWSDVSTPAELSIASVLILRPASAASTLPRCVKPRLAPSPITRARSCAASTRTASLVRSPASPLPSLEAFTYVPMPPK